MKNKCPQCGAEFEMSERQQYNFNKGKLVFCSKSCSGKYYSHKQHSEETDEQRLLKNKKISETLKEKELTISQEKLYEKVERLNSFWKDLSPEQRSERNKKNAIKAKQTKLDRYGSETYNNRNKAQQTSLEKYNVKNTYRLEKSINKAKMINKEKYGVDYFFSNRERFKEVSLEKYGVSHPMQNQEIKDKLSNTKFINWGDVNYNNQNKFEKTFLEKYGVRRPFYIEKFKIKSQQTKLKRYGNANYNNRVKALKTVYEKYGKDFYEKQALNLGNKISNINKEFAKYIGITDFEFPIGKFSYDLKKENTLIEIDPTFTHNSLETKLFNRFGNLDMLYHQNKTNTAIQAGYNCIHVFDWDDWEKIKYLVQDKQTLYARNLGLKEVSLEDTAEFLNNYHLQNNCRGQIVRLGLYKNDELIEIMTFGKPRYNRNYEWELLRLCTKAEYKVVGGAEKLFKHFIEKYSPKNVISYCDFSKFTGDVYTRLGFEMKGKPKQSKHWSKGEEHITDNLLRQRGFDQLFGTNYGKGTSNEELMLENGWLPIYDCGQLTFIWKK